MPDLLYSYILRIQYKLFPALAHDWLKQNNHIGLRTILRYGSTDDQRSALKHLSVRNISDCNDLLATLAFHDFLSIAQQAIQLLETFATDDQYAEQIDRAKAYLRLRQTQRRAYI